MTVIRQTRSAASRLPAGRLILLLTLVLTIVAACGPGSGGGPSY